MNRRYVWWFVAGVAIAAAVAGVRALVRDTCPREESTDDLAEEIAAGHPLTAPEAVRR